MNFLLYIDTYMYLGRYVYNYLYCTFQAVNSNSLLWHLATYLPRYCTCVGTYLVGRHGSNSKVVLPSLPI